ncbi:MAG: Arc family DNA-binding protein [Sphingobacteriia bacterium]|nr:Arc family DNA-binding protein [Sphingobacteriia bacterium]
MSKKKTFVLRLNPSTMEMLEKWAADEFRSINGQIEWIIHNALKQSGRLKEGTESEAPASKTPEP